jgi:hypothetical protein
MDSRWIARLSPGDAHAARWGGVVYSGVRGVAYRTCQKVTTEPGSSSMEFNFHTIGS